MKQDTITDPPEVKSVIREYCKKIYTYIFDNLHWTTFLKNTNYQNLLNTVKY